LHVVQLISWPPAAHFLSLGTSPALLFSGPASALDGIARPGTERLKKRCRGTQELFHGVTAHNPRPQLLNPPIGVGPQRQSFREFHFPSTSRLVTAIQYEQQKPRQQRIYRHHCSDLLGVTERQEGQ
jgi:hypothetical protein